MGVNKLRKFIQERTPDAFFKLDIVQLTGMKVAIDANNWMFTNYAIAMKKVVDRINVAVQDPDPSEVRRVWFSAVFNFISKWVECRILPVFVFDGEHPPEKADTKRKRGDTRRKLREKINKTKHDLQNIDLFDRATLDVEELQKNMANDTSISPADFEAFRNFLGELCVPVVQAKGDGEQLCSSLCIEGKVAAVFSTDTDNLVYGCPLLITNFSKEWINKSPHLDCIRADKVLEGLQMNREEFVDFCIMCGTDFNENMKGYASKKCFNLIKEHRSIDVLPAKFDVSCLNHRRCREIFSHQSSSDLVLGQCDLRPIIENQQAIYHALTQADTKTSFHYYMAHLSNSGRGPREADIYSELGLETPPIFSSNKEQIIFYV